MTNWARFGFPKLCFGRFLIDLETWFGKELFLALIGLGKNSLTINLGRLSSLVGLLSSFWSPLVGTWVTFRSLEELCSSFGALWGDLVGSLIPLFVRGFLVWFQLGFGENLYFEFVRLLRGFF